jgi:hypothetical protein
MTYLEIALQAKRNKSIQQCEKSAQSEKSGTWPPESSERFAQPHAKLFPFLGRKVKTPAGIGTLLQVFADRATVLLDSELSLSSFFIPGQIEPVSREI